MLIKKTKAKDLRIIGICLSKMDTSKLTVENLKNVVKLNKSITTESSEIGEVQKKLFEQFGVKIDPNGNFDWSGHEKEKEITEKMTELNNSEVSLTPSNFMNEEEFYDAMKGMSVPEISALESILCITGQETNK